MESNPGLECAFQFDRGLPISVQTDTFMCEFIPHALFMASTKINHSPVML